MSLRTELHTLLALQDRPGYPDSELVKMAEKYGIDPHEMGFIWDVAVQGKLDRLGGIDLDKEVDGGT